MAVRTEAAQVLIVEDDRHIARLLAEALRDDGYTSRIAANGREALEMLHRQIRRPGVIVLDLMMPVMDGLEFRQAQLADPELAEIPVIVMSAAHQYAMREYQLGDVAFVPKPFELDHVIAAVALKLHSRGVRP